jgi:SAM-dependent methyltransferase
MATDPSYERTARYYDSAYATVTSLGPDVKFYEALAAGNGGPVLELGCGTGRALLPIAARGIRCAGVDASPAMLEEFRAKPGADAVDLSCQRMESFDLPGRRYRMIFSAFRGFQHLDEVQQQLDCLARVRAHLEPGGVFAFDVFNPRLERIAADVEPESVDVTFILGSTRVQRFATIERDRARQVIQVTMRYVETRPSEPPQETIVRFSMRWFWRFELDHLMHRAGFRDVAIHGDFDGSPVTRDCPAFVVVAR